MASQNGLFFSKLSKMVFSLEREGFITDEECQALCCFQSVLREKYNKPETRVLARFYTADLEKYYKSRSKEDKQSLFKKTAQYESEILSKLNEIELKIISVYCVMNELIVKEMTSPADLA